MSGMLYTMKIVLSRPRRCGGWGEFLRDRKIPRVSADQLVARFQRNLGKENCLSKAITEPTKEDVQKIFSAIWPRLRKTLTSAESVYQFIHNLAAESGARHELRDDGILVFDSPYETTEGTPATTTPPVWEEGHQGTYAPEQVRETLMKQDMEKK